MVELVLRGESGDDVRVYEGTVEIGSVIQVNGGHWVVVAEEEIDRVGVSARYVCSPAD